MKIKLAIIIIIAVFTLTACNSQNKGFDIENFKKKVDKHDTRGKNLDKARKSIFPKLK